MANETSGIKAAHEALSAVSAAVGRSASDNLKKTSDSLDHLAFTLSTVEGGAPSLDQTAREATELARWLDAWRDDPQISGEGARQVDARVHDFITKANEVLLSPIEPRAVTPEYDSLAASTPSSTPRSGDRWPEFSNSVRQVARDLGTSELTTASAIAQEIRSRHPNYAAGRLESVLIDVTVGVRLPLDEWLSLVRSRYDLSEIAQSRHKVIDGRLTLAALALLDPPLAEQLGDTLTDLLNECEIRPTPLPPPEHVRWMTDEPVNLDGDELGRRGVARALEQQLRTLARDFPGQSFLVELEGRWGTGKSTLLRFLRDLVVVQSAEPWLVIPYDAWRQSRAGPPWLTLLQALRSGVRSGRQRRWTRWTLWLRERTKLVEAWHWLALALMTSIGVVLGAFVIRPDRHVGLSNVGDATQVVSTLIAVAGAVWLAALAASRFLALDSRRSAAAFLETRVDPMEDLAAYFCWLLNEAGRPVLILVDDIDRCPETFVVDFLDTVQKLMRDHGPKSHRIASGPGSSLFVVVAADSRWIRRSYDNAYASLAAAVQEPGVTVGSLFLEKLFQLTVPVPQLSEDLKAEYLHDLLTERTERTHRSANTDLVRRLSDAPHDEVLEVLSAAPAIERVRVSDLAIERLVVEPGAQQSTRHALEPYAPMLDPTPRGMKRFVMAYSMLRAVRTAEGSVVPVGPLALWTIIRTRWPLLADYLQTAPDAVTFFNFPADRMPSWLPVELLQLFTDPPPELRVVMNHPDGPMNARVISECSGQTSNRPNDTEATTGPPTVGV